MNVDELLKQKGEIHGNFEDNAELLEKFIGLMEASPNYSKLSSMHKYCLRMIFLKICRMLCGDILEPDSPKDLAGYATGLYDYVKKYDAIRKKS